MKDRMRILEAAYPRSLWHRAKPEKREHEYIRHGTGLDCLVCSRDGSGHVESGPDPRSTDFANHLANVINNCQTMHRYDWVVDNLNTTGALTSACGGAVVQVPLVAKDLRHGVQRRAT